MVSCCCGRQGFGERQRGTTCTICLPQQHDTICCKKHLFILQINKLLLLHLIGSSILIYHLFCLWLTHHRCAPINRCIYLLCCLANHNQKCYQVTCFSLYPGRHQPYTLSRCYEINTRECHILICGKYRILLSQTSQIFLKIYKKYFKLPTCFIKNSYFKYIKTCLKRTPYIPETWTNGK